MNQQQLEDEIVQLAAIVKGIISFVDPVILDGSLAMQTNLELLKQHLENFEVKMRQNRE